MRILSCNIKKNNVAVDVSVVICIPIYKNELSVYEQVSLRQLNTVLGKYPRVFIAPESLSFDFGVLGKGIGVERFPDYFFNSVMSYSALLLNVEFYRRFIDYEYMLIYQTDAFVFTNKLQEFCGLGLDYIGAPMSRFDPMWNYIGKRVGNGGFSLRKISSAIAMLSKWKEIAANTPLESFFWQWEDIFWSYCSRRKDLNFQVADLRTAVQFAVQGDVARAYKRMEKGWRPFGCHGWWQTDYSFWRAVINAAGYHLDERLAVKISYPRKNKYILARSSFDCRYLWKLYNEGNFVELLKLLDSWLVQFPDTYRGWQLIMEELICLWRMVAAEKNRNTNRLKVLRKLAVALERSLKQGVDFPICWNMLITMFPYLQELDYGEIQSLAVAINKSWWNMWTEEVCFALPQNVQRNKRIVTLTSVVNEVGVLESFVRHTLTFADAMVIDVSDAVTSCKKILTKLLDEDLPLVLHENKLTITQIKDSMNFVISLTPMEFLVPQSNALDVRAILEEMDDEYSFCIEREDYNIYLPYIYNDQFVLARPLVRLCDTSTYVNVIHGKLDDCKVAKELYMIRFVKDECMQLLRGIMPSNGELNDVRSFVQNHRLEYAL